MSSVILRQPGRAGRHFALLRLGPQCFCHSHGQHTNAEKPSPVVQLGDRDDPHVYGMVLACCVVRRVNRSLHLPHGIDQEIVRRTASREARHREKASASNERQENLQPPLADDRTI